MQSYICMLCKKADVDLANIFLKNGRNNSTRDDILDLYGNKIEQYLKTDDLVCVNCIQVLDNVVKLKKQVYEIIIDHAFSRDRLGIPGTKVFNLSKVWNLRLTNTTSAYSSYDRSTEVASPNDLLMITRSIPYDQRSDTDMEIANSKYRNYDSDSALDREVHEMTLRHRRRIRGHNWTRRKGSQKSRERVRAFSSSRSTYSRASRISSSSRLSRATTSSRKYKIQKESKKSQMRRILGDFLYQNDSLSQFAQAYLKGCAANNIDISENFASLPWTTIENGKPIVKTRFASEIRDKLLSEYQKLVYECPENTCHETLYSLEAITDHRVKKHNEMALFWCEQCKFSYLSQEHLDKHKEKQHYGTFIQYCIYCSEEYTNKTLYEEHLNEHLIHSFPCIYCDKFFLRKQLCEKHIREQHPGRKKKIKRIKPQSILDRIDKQPENSELDGRNSTNNNSSEKFVVKVLWQHGRPEDSSTTTEEDLEDASCVDLNFEEAIAATQENQMELISSSN